MSTSRSGRPTALAPQQAVQDYLDALLQDATRVALQPRPEVQIADKEEAASKQPEESLLAPDAEVSKSSAPQSTSEASALEGPSPWRNGRPAWAQQRFECLLFEVAGLTLAVPLAELGGVLRMDADLSPLFGQPDWFLGLLRAKTEGTVRVIDTARWVLAERYDIEAAAGTRFVILMEDSGWGLACHRVADAITLEPEAVKWRSHRGRRPWLAGTVIEHMCAILDVPALVELLQAQSGSTKS